MDIIFAILAFVIFSLISDALEGKRKKRQQDQLPPTTADDQKASPEQSRTKIVIPPIKGAPAGKQNNPTISQPSVQPQGGSVDPRYMAALKQQKQPNKTVSEPLQVAVMPASHSADIHTDVLLNAIAYTQILQPPKAYQYLATRSCRGDWQNNK